MRLGTLGAACALCAGAVPASAIGQSPADATAPAPPQQPVPPAETPSPPAPQQQPVAPAQTPPPPALVPAALPLPGDMRTAAVHRLIGHHVGLTRRYQRLMGEHLTRGERREIHQTLGQLPPPEVRAKTRELRADIRQLRGRLERKHGGAPDIAIPPVLESIAHCESHGNPRAISAGGMYRGKYQFSYSTWASVGGEGDPAAASETEQDRRAALLYRSGGAGHWPVCGR